MTPTIQVQGLRVLREERGYWTRQWRQRGAGSESTLCLVAPETSLVVPELGNPWGMRIHKKDNIRSGDMLQKKN